MTTPPDAITVRPLPHPADDRSIEGLIDVLCDCVEGGASVSFMLPLTRDRARTYWRSVADSASRGERLLLIAEEPDGQVIGTVQVILSQPENQPHRGDLAKMLVHRRGRRLGIGAVLMHAAESAALAAGKTLLVLDTASPEASRLYTRCGWTEVGRIPGYALLPAGGPCDTVYYYKQLR